MDKMLYVANLDPAVTDLRLEQLFADFGVVVSARVAVAGADARSRGFGFVEMQTNQAARAARRPARSSASANDMSPRTMCGRRFFHSAR